MTVDIAVTGSSSGGQVADAKPQDLVTVTVSVPYSKIARLPPNTFGKEPHGDGRNAARIGPSIGRPSTVAARCPPNPSDNFRIVSIRRGRGACGV